MVTCNVTHSGYGYAVDCELTMRDNLSSPVHLYLCVVLAFLLFVLYQARSSLILVFLNIVHRLRTNPPSREYVELRNTVYQDI